MTQAAVVDRSVRRRLPAPVAVKEQFDALRAQFPPRPVPWSWPASQYAAQDVMHRLTSAPFRASSPVTHDFRTKGVRAMLEWLEQYPGGS